MLLKKTNTKVLTKEYLTKRLKKVIPYLVNYTKINLKKIEIS